MSETLTAPQQTKANASPARTDIRELVDRGGKLSIEIARLEKKKLELDLIKKQLRELADGKDQAFAGSQYTATVENKPDTVCRVVDSGCVARAVKIAGESLLALFTLHPSKGNEKNFELNALKTLPKNAGRRLVDLLQVEATPWVRFS